MCAIKGKKMKGQIHRITGELVIITHSPSFPPRSRRSGQRIHTNVGELNSVASATSRDFEYYSCFPEEHFNYHIVDIQKYLLSILLFMVPFFFMNYLNLFLNKCKLCVCPGSQGLHCSVCVLKSSTLGLIEVRAWNRGLSSRTVS